MTGEVLLLIFAFALVVSGLVVGIAVPILPGVPMAWLGMVLFAYATHFAVITWRTLLLFLVFVIVALLIDFVAPLIGARRYHASKYGLYGAGLGVLFGMVLLGPIGILIGPAAGAVIGELAYGKEPDEAIESSKGALLGFLAGSLIKFVLILVMLGFMLSALF
ncbi:DUF456 family protein [Patescibacteria group bacterium]|nr:DUF456 family protein [Patescibacteria group bacterium]